METTPAGQLDNGGINGEGEGAKLAVDTTNTSPPDPNTPKSVTSPVTSPPYWVQSHQRSVSNISVESISAGGITLQDNTDSPHDSRDKFCWAKSVYIEDHVVINEHRRTGIGAFVVWIVTVETLRVCSDYIDTKKYTRLTLLRAHPSVSAKDTRSLLN